MRKIERLRREGLKQATAKGHVMGRFCYHDCAGRTIGQSACTLCGVWLSFSTSSAYESIRAPKGKCHPTIAYIAERNAAAGGYYFSRDTLRFFGQRRSNFKVHVRAGRVFVQASSYQGGNYMGESFAEFKPKTGKVTSVRNDAKDTTNKREVAEFLAGLE